jgi:hypothetical protein
LNYLREGKNKIESPMNIALIKNETGKVRIEIKEIECS